MLSLLTGTLHGVSPKTLARVAQELADSTIDEHAILHVLLEKSGPVAGIHRVVLTLDRPATSRLVERYELEPSVFLRVETAGVPALLPAVDAWLSVRRTAPVPRRRAARAP